MILLSIVSVFHTDNINKNQRLAMLFKSIITIVLFALITDINCQNNLPVTQQCLGCICEAISACDTKSQCEGNVCGPFRITWAYWADSGKPTVNNESPDSQQAYANCARDTYCSAIAVQGYMQKFQQDCNGDGKIDCDDFAAIHKYGGYGCKGAQLTDLYGQRYYQCKALVA